MKLRLTALAILGMLTSGTALAEGAAPVPPVVNYQAAPIVITGQGDDEAVLFALPANPPPALVAQKTKIEDLRLKLKAERAKLVELVKSFDFDQPSANQGALAKAIEDCKAQVQDLEELEAGYVLDRDLHVADGVQSTAAVTAPLAH